MSRFDDLAPLIAPARLPDAPALGYRQGVIESWNPLTAENEVRIGGTLFANIPILNTSEALLLAAGDVVGVLVTGSGGASTYAILGRLTIPGTPDAAQTLGAGLKVARVLGSTAISSAGYALNSGPSLVTNVLTTGRVYLTASAGIDLDVGEGVDLAVFGTGPSGATVTAVCYLTSKNLLTVSTGILGGTINTAAGASELLTGLTPGSWTFELRSRKTHGSGNPDVHSRVLTALPM